MVDIDKNSFGYLGIGYQERLIAQILTDDKFANSIIDIINPNYFDDQYLRIIVGSIKNAKEIDDIIPDMGSLEFRLIEDLVDSTQRRFALSQLRKIKDANLNDTLKVQDMAMKFCKQQELKKALVEINKIISLGNIEDYELCESKLRKALDHGDNKDDGMNIFDNIANVLNEDFRKPIKTGISGLDGIMNGGLAKGELAVILAAYGTGKTTMMVKIANTAMLDGKKVLQIFFEDNPKVIQQKHLACWSKYDLNQLVFHKDELMDMVKDMMNSGEGELRLKKFSSHGTTIPMVRQYIRKLIAQGFKPDIILLDYIDCIEPSRRFDDINAGEGSVMREFESLLNELDIAGWTAVQGNRQSLGTEVVEANQMGGSIKKGQIGHFIVSVGKTLDQKEKHTATMTIIKSRFGRDGMIFNDIIFNNSTIQIDMSSNDVAKSRSEFKQSTSVKQQTRLNAMLDSSIKPLFSDNK